MFVSTDEVIVNADDIAGHWTNAIWAVRLDTGTAWLSEPFIVAADCEQDAFDAIADYCVDAGWLGYIVTGDEVYADCTHYFLQEDCDCDEGYIPAGNGHTYIRDDGNTRIVKLARRVNYNQWRWIVAPVFDTVTLDA